MVVLSDVDMVFKWGSVEWGWPRQKHVTSSHRGPHTAGSTWCFVCQGQAGNTIELYEWEWGLSESVSTASVGFHRIRDWSLLALVKPSSPAVLRCGKKQLQTISVKWWRSRFLKIESESGKVEEDFRSTSFHFSIRFNNGYECVR